MEKLYDYKKSQDQLKSFWQEKSIYKMDSQKEVFSIDTPPPTVSGSLHIGHIFSYTQTDIIARYKRMCGFAVFYPFGFDDNGLPTERFVEKKRDVQAYQMKRSEFIELCLTETHEVEKEFKNLWQTIGLSVDWQHCYSTISPESRKISQESFIRLYQKGYVYRKHEPALYCTTCRTTVAQAELDDSEKPSFFNDIVFKDEQGNNLVVGTTRPEFLASCVAILYNPQDPRYQHLKGQKAQVPLYNFTVPIIADDAVLIEKGTGLVMCCTFGDKTDISWIKKYNLPHKITLGFDGKFAEGLPFIGGMRVASARQEIIKALDDAELLINQKPIMHAVNVHERCKKEIEYLILTQWFLAILPYKQQLIELADHIAWYPSYMKSRYVNWVQALSWDWCLSRQRFYGIPFPVWHCDNGHSIMADIKDLPIDPQEVVYSKPCPECGSTTIVADTDVMDTWNTSSLTPQLCNALYDPENNVFEPKTAQKFLPMSMRPQAHDIIRTWAFYTIMKSWMHYDMVPWKNIVISGHVLSDSKEKLSKSKDNAKTAPETLLQTYPADVIRYWTASGRLGQDIAFSDNQLKIGQRLITKLWNAFRFVSEHITDKNIQRPRKLGMVNEWLLHHYTKTFKIYTNYLNEYEFSLALDAIEKFFWNEFCDNYIELVKEQFFKPELYNQEEVEATRWTLHRIGLKILQLYAPFLPYITDSIYQELYKNSFYSSIHQTLFEVEEYTFETSDQIMQQLIKVIAAVRALKTEKQLSLKVPLKNLILNVENKKFDELSQIIKGVTHTETISYSLTSQGSSLYNENEHWIACVTID